MTISYNDPPFLCLINILEVQLTADTEHAVGAGEGVADQRLCRGYALGIMGSVLLIIFDPYSNLIFWVNLTLLSKSPLYKGIGASEVQVRYPQCTSPTSNALYIGILALSSEVSEDTTLCLTPGKNIGHSFD